FFREFDITGEDTVIQLSAYSFDAFVEEMFPLLVRGGKIVIPDHSDIPDMESLARLITENGVTIVDCSPLLLNEFNKLTLKSTTSEANPLAGVRLFISGGDVLKAEYVNNLLNTGAVYNTYGPTETTVCAAYYKCGVPLPADVPIGKPIANYRVYVLDRDNEPVPIGVTGEICISGPGVARGYLNRPELTSEKFYRSYRTNMSYI
ncbi:MAG: amino acid adenylation domain-containing protein, partial [bacterium]|nr:amino acid adenylation domain-containing protein [bacterium]